MSSDYQLEDTVYLPFTTRAFATGIPTVLAGTPAIDIYEDVTATPIITGETLAVDLNSVPGFNMITVTATDATGFEAGKSYTAIIQAGTVDSVSVVGEVVAHFTLDKSAAAKDLANGTDGLGAIKTETALIVADTDELQSDDVPTLISGLNNITAANVWAVDATGEQTQGTFGQAVGDPGATAKSLWQATVSDAAGVSVSADVIAIKAETVLIVADTNELQVDNVPGLIATVQADLDIITDGDGVILGAAAVDLIWDEVITGAFHNVNNSSGKRLRLLAEAGVYEGGAVWIDTVNGTAGTTIFDNGTVINPVLTLADAKTIADNASLKIKRFIIISGSSLSLGADYSGYSFIGDAWTLALNSQTIDAAYFEGCTVTGTYTGTPHFMECEIGVAGITGTSGSFGDCSLAGDILVSGVGDWFLHHCWSAIAGTSTPAFDFAVGVASTNLNMRDYSGGIEIKNMGQSATDNMSLEGNGQLIVNASSTGGTIALRGNFKVTNNGSSTIVLDDDTTNINAILVDTAVIGTAGAGLTDLGGMSTAMKTEVESEANDALVAVGLDHLVGASVTGADVTDDSIIAKLVSKEATADWDDFANTTESLQALRDQGDSAWATAVGFSTHSAAAIWAVDATSEQTGGTFGQAIGDPLSNTETMYDAIVKDAAGTNVAADIIAMKIDTAATLVDTAVIGALGAGLTNIPWNSSWDAEVQSEVADALVVVRLDELLAADSDIDGAAPPTVGSVFHELLTKTPGSFTYDQTTDSLEAVRDNQGATPPTANAIADQVWNEAQVDHVTTGSFGIIASEIAAIPTTAMRGTDSALTDKAGFSLSTAGILAIWHQAVSAIVTASSIGKLLKDEITSVRMAVLTDWINGGRLDSLLDAIPTTAMRGTDSAALASDDVPGLIAALNDFDPTAQLTESYAANGVAPTSVQTWFAIHQMLMQFGISGTSITVRKLDDATTAFIVTLDDGTSPTDAKRV